MNCHEARQMLAPWTDHELSQRDAQFLELHMRSCQDCAGLAGREQSFIHALKAQLRPEATMPDALKASLLQSLARPPAPRAGQRPLARGLASLASLALAVVLLMLIPPRVDSTAWTQFYLDDHQAHLPAPLRVQHPAGTAKELAAWLQ